MRAGTIAGEDGPQLVIELDGRWYDYMGLSLSAIAEVSGFGAEEIGALGSVGSDVRDVIEPENEGNVLQVFDSAPEEVLGRFQVPEPEAFLLPFRPGKIVAVGRNYAAHAAELGNDVPEEPLFFGKSPTACIGPGEPIVLADWYGRVDFEGELAVVIGDRAKGISPEEAPRCIAGYTLLNDVTARDLQHRDKDRGHPWFRSKNMDTFCPLGPVMAFPGALPWPVHVPIETRVNGDVRQQSTTDRFLFPIPALLAHISRFMTLEPGDVVATGTPEGVGPIQSGDIVEIIQPAIGTLRNPVVSSR